MRWEALDSLGRGSDLVLRGGYESGAVRDAIRLRSGGVGQYGVCIFLISLSHTLSRSET